jgi:hypothetical protein
LSCSVMPGMSSGLETSGPATVYQKPLFV